MQHNKGTYWINNLRSAITLLVVAHHSSLAYTTFASFNKEAYINSTHPVVDSQRWVGLDIFVNFNDIFFMSLMFLIGGLFLSHSITQKGVVQFITDRFYRLFLPFILGGTLLMMIAYIPSYMLAHGTFDGTLYIIDFFTTEKWPVGPPWFIWVLFGFNLVFALSWHIMKPAYTALSKKMNHIKKAAVLFLVFYMLTWVLYVPIAYTIGAGTWTGLGPFDFQLSRIALYYGYFMVGICIGAGNFKEMLFSYRSPIIKHWKIWMILAIVTYTLLTCITEFKVLEKEVMSGNLPVFTAWMIYFSIYAASCVLSCFTLLTLFRVFFNFQNRFWVSLNHHAYLIYLIHYVFVLWFQWMFLSLELPALLKCILVFVLSVGGSWLVSIPLKKIYYIEKYV